MLNVSIRFPIPCNRNPAVKKLELSVKPVVLTYKDAKELMERNINNRPKQASRVARFKSQHLRGLWRRRNPVFIIIDTEGKLQNGQHALTAFIQAEEERASNPTKYADVLDIYGEPCLREPIEIAAVIVEGIAPEDADLIDDVKARTQADVLYRKFAHLFPQEDEKGRPIDRNSDVRKKLSSILATAAKIVYFRLNHGQRPRASIKFENADAIATVEQNAPLPYSVDFVFAMNTKKDKEGCLSSLVQLPYLAAFHYLAWHSQQNEDGTGKLQSRADAFIKALATGTLPGVEDLENHPYIRLRNWLITQQKQTQRGNEFYNQMFDALVLAWNAVNGPREPLKAKQPFAYNAEVMPMMGGLDSYAPPEPEPEPAPVAVVEPEAPAVPSPPPTAPRKSAKGEERATRKTTKKAVA